MHRSSPLLPALAAALLLVTLPGGLHAQAMDKMSKESKPAMGAMKDTSAMKHDGAMMDHGAMDKGAMDKGAMGKDEMAKDGMAKDGMAKEGMAPGKSKTKAKSGSKGAMAEPPKMSHP